MAVLLDAGARMDIRGTRDHYAGKLAEQAVYVHRRSLFSRASGLLPGEKTHVAITEALAAGHGDPQAALRELFDRRDRVGGRLEDVAWLCPRV